MAASGMKKWVVAAFLVILGGTALTIYDLLQPDPVEPTAKKADDEEKSEAPLTADPLFEEPAAPVFVVPAAEETPALLEPPPGRLPPPLLSPTTEPGTTRPASATEAAPIRREGTVLTDVRGAVARVGNRYEFRPADGSAPLILLENQLLERILYLQQHGGPGPSSNAWVLTGVVTEFQRNNYLLIQLLKID